MKSNAIGGLLMFMACLAAATKADALQIQIVGESPTHVYTTDTQTTYQGTVLGIVGCYFKLWVYQNGTQKYLCDPFWVSGTPPFTVSHVVTGMGTWGLQVGQEIKYKAKVWKGLSFDFDDWIRYVEQGGSTYAPTQDRRSTPSGHREELYAAVKNDEEQPWA